MRRRTVVLVAGLLALLLAAPAANAASRGGRTVLEFDAMVGVAEPFTGATNAIRGVPGGGLPWDIRSARGELRGNGRLEIDVRGLVLARRAPVPPERQGTNPSASFRAIVSCVTSRDGVATTVNVSSELAPATARGDSKIEDTLELPSPCLAPIVFVASPAGAWFAATGS
jgi:hypothetical protein